MFFKWGWCTCFVLCIAVTRSQLTADRLAIFGPWSGESAAILRADSMLIETVDYYNSRVSRGYCCISLSDDEYQTYLGLVQMKELVKPYLSQKERLLERKLNGLSETLQDSIRSIYRSYELIGMQLDSLEKIGRPDGKDSLVWTYGWDGPLDLSNYYRQYEFLDSSILQVHACCAAIIQTLDNLEGDSEMPMWKKYPLTIHDGGNCYFTLMLDLSTRRAYRMRVNGI